MSKIKYSSLEPFVYGLARFTLPNGTVGFFDRRGREYFNIQETRTLDISKISLPTYEEYIL